jgi:hypothetical protein
MLNAMVSSFPHLVGPSLEDLVYRLGADNSICSQLKFARIVQGEGKRNRGHRFGQREYTQCCCRRQDRLIVQGSSEESILAWSDYTHDRYGPFWNGGRIQMPAITLPSLGLWMGIASLIFGIIVMIFPKILNYLIGLYLIIIGIMAIIGYVNR